MRRSTDGRELKKDRLVRFLSDFYGYAGYGNDPELIAMIQQINSIETL